MTYGELLTGMGQRIAQGFGAGAVIRRNMTAQGFSRPSFYLKLIPVSSTPEGRFYLRRRVIVAVHYFPKADAEHDAEELYGVMEQLEGLLSGVLALGNRKLLAEQVESAISDHVLITSATLAFLDTVDIDTLLGGGADATLATELHFALE